MKSTTGNPETGVGVEDGGGLIRANGACTAVAAIMQTSDDGEVAQLCDAFSKPVRTDIKFGLSYDRSGGGQRAMLIG